MLILDRLTSRSSRSLARMLARAWPGGSRSGRSGSPDDDCAQGDTLLPFLPSFPRPTLPYAA
jgi:hypothetical protein